MRQRDRLPMGLALCDESHNTDRDVELEIPSAKRLWFLRKWDRGSFGDKILIPSGMI